MKMALRKPTMPWTIIETPFTADGMAGIKINLIHESDLKNVPLGTQLVSIMGEVAVVGIDPMDLDSRNGYLAWGFFGDPDMRGAVDHD